MPGGAYRPDRETPQQAGVREVSEELALTVTEEPTVLDTVFTTLEGKRDTLTIVQATPVSASFVRSPEIAEARWVRADMAAMPDCEPVSRGLERALAVRNMPASQEALAPRNPPLPGRSERQDNRDVC
jgi:8-oxo-dGTP diphosphatase